LIYLRAQRLIDRFATATQEQLRSEFPSELGVLPETLRSEAMIEDARYGLIGSLQGIASNSLTKIVGTGLSRGIGDSIESVFTRGLPGRLRQAYKWTNRARRGIGSLTEPESAAVFTCSARSGCSVEIERR
jgi:hypothetical protein